MSSILGRLTRLRAQYFPKLPKPDVKNPASRQHQEYLAYFPKHAKENGWAPTESNPYHPFHLPASWQGTYATVLGGVFWFWIMYRWKQDSAFEIFNIIPFEDEEQSSGEH
ncbi:hypothetical protein MP228_001874 [Amoeboaphelidium protococcarum]|nr:hypothetical protein MP228_001874 [Amoeboaphelidium protococcarum]